MKAPSDMYFESVVQPEHDGKLLLDSLCMRFTYHSRQDWIEKLQRGLVSHNGEMASEQTVAQKGAKVVYHVENYTETEVPTDHHTGRIFYNTFTSIIRRETGYDTATPMHRLDRDTGGLMLFAKYAESAARFQKNLDRILLQKFYIAVVRGKFEMVAGERTTLADDGSLDCSIALREDPLDPIRIRMHFFEDGKECHTRFRLLKQGLLPHGEGYSVVEAELITGRKHQIRAHLAELGYPILGDRLYSFDGKYYKKMTEKVAEARAQGELSQENALSEEDYAILGGHSHMLYAYKAVIQLPYWKSPRTFISEDYPDEMKKIISVR